MELYSPVISKHTRFRDGSGNLVDFDGIADKIVNWIAKDPEKEYVIAVGTDSQTCSDAKIVLAITVHKLNNGGIFFIHTIRHEPFLKNQLQQKLYTETQISLDATELLVEKMLDRDVDIMDDSGNIHLTIHIDVGQNGPTRNYIQELEGWVHAMGYDCRIKPDSYAASSVADRYSK